MSRTSRTPATGQADTANRRKHPLRSAITFICIMGAVGSLAFLATSDFGANALDQVGTSVGGGAKRFVASVRIEPAELDFGEVQVGTTATGTVRVVNDGTRAVRITEIRTTCGCTVAERPKEIIRPGEEVEVKVRMDVASTSGRTRTKSLTFDFGDRLEPIRVPVTARSREFVEVTPPAVHLVASGTNSIVVRALDGRPFRVTKAVPPLFRPSDRERSVHQFDVSEDRWRALGSPRRVTLYLDHPKVGRLELQIHREVTLDDSNLASVFVAVAAVGTSDLSPDRSNAHPERMVP